MQSAFYKQHRFYFFSFKCIQSVMLLLSVLFSSEIHSRADIVSGSLSGSGGGGGGKKGFPRFTLEGGGGWAASVRDSTGGSSFYEAVLYKGRLGYNLSSRSEWSIQYSLSEQSAADLLTVPQILSDTVYSVFWRRSFGARQVFVQVGGNYHLVQATEPDTGFGLALGGGLSFPLRSWLALGLTLNMGTNYFRSTGTMRRLFSMTADLTLYLF